METLSKILNKSFDFSATHVGLLVNDDLWVHDKWIVVINGESFDYHTGIGHRVEKDRYSQEDFKKRMNQNPKKTKDNLLLYANELKKVSKLKPIEIDDVLYSLITDANYVND